MNTNRYYFSGKVSKPMRFKTMELLDAWDFQSDAKSIYIEPLEGGLNNVNLILNNGSDKWVLKNSTTGSRAIWGCS